MAANNLLACEFEVHGKVQGVFFRKYTESQAKKLGLRGWVMNTSAGTVKGKMEGSDDALNEMKNWLQHRGSPKSSIEKAVFSNAKPILNYSFPAFTIQG